MKDLPIGIQTFKSLIEGNFVYVDKTKYIYPLVAPAQGVYFLSRPRRFGKSLLISTLEQIFFGNKELFKGLWIYDQPFPWKKHPVVRIDFSQRRMETAADLKEFLSVTLIKIAKSYGVELKQSVYDLQFIELLPELAKQNKVVILIDEYDKPILDHILEPTRAAEMRDLLKGFYGVIKASDEYMRFVLLTGVSKFSKVGVFSGLNNLLDLTMAPDFTALLGYTEEEIDQYFDDHLSYMATAKSVQSDALRNQLRNWYNGYQFSSEPPKVYNPFSLMSALKNKVFQNFWFETGTPTFLLELIKNKDYDLRNLSPLDVGINAFAGYEVDNLRVEPLLYQTGYITIKNYDPETRLYTLGYPNLEVEDSFLQYLMDTQGSIPKEIAESYLVQLIIALKNNDLDSFFTTLRVFFANIPYDLQIAKERYYQTIFYLVFTLLGLRIQAEVKTNNGRADVVIETKTHVYIFEFKLFDSKESALAQIKENKYWEKYAGAGPCACPDGSHKQIILVGAEFNPQERNIGEWVTEALF